MSSSVMFTFTPARRSRGWSNRPARRSASPSCRGSASRPRRSERPRPASRFTSATAPLRFGRVVERVVVVVELRVGVGLVRELERLHEVVLADDRVPRRMAKRAVIVERFVHHVPAFDSSLVAADDGEDVIAHPSEQRVATHRIPGRVLEYPARHLAVPHQRVADDKHSVTRAEIDVAVGRREVVLAEPRVHVLPLEHVLRRDRVELPRESASRRPNRAGELTFVDSRADAERARERVLERRRSAPPLGDALGCGTRRRATASASQRASCDGAHLTTAREPFPLVPTAVSGAETPPYCDVVAAPARLPSVRSPSA